jgi:hypothetical protein
VKRNEQPQPIVHHPGRDPEKERSRLEDERALASGEKSYEQLRRENAHFSRMKVRLAVERIKAYS